MSMKTVQEQFIAMEERLDDIDQKVDKMASNLDKIYEKLVGNELSPEGLIMDLENVKHDIKVLKEFKSKIMWTISLIVGTGGVLGYLLGLLFSYLSAKH